MKVTLSERKQVFHVRNTREKELIHTYNFVTPNGKRIVDCRLYMGRSSNASVIYCLLWTYNPKLGVYREGSGKAGGWGYDKMSASVGDAIYNAGYDLECNISGVGTGATREAIESIAEFMGVKGFLIETYA